ncbi:nitrous oxide-stimulated promoter family protein [Photobacterium nomapromontoriensis]|uniref:nitrous oxide-stimulated promoter family protein n=1 Tax=Photobacterium nomapromontoriensis TaxID=2910237 RepID=UPI003D13AFEA
MTKNKQQPILLGCLATEFKTIQAMVAIYCQDHHQTHALCTKCQDFLEYTHTRLDRCPYGENKPTCKECPIHCYKADYKQRSLQIMRYAGPKMLFRHPLLAIRHLLSAKKAVPLKPEANASNRHKRKMTQLR